MPDTHTTSVDQQRLEKERIEDDGTVTLTRPCHPLPDRHRPDRGAHGSAAGAKDHQV